MKMNLVHILVLFCFGWFRKYSIFSKSQKRAIFGIVVKKRKSNFNIKFLIYIYNKSDPENMFNIWIQKSYLIWNSYTS